MTFIDALYGKQIGADLFVYLIKLKYIWHTDAMRIISASIQLLCTS